VKKRLLSFALVVLTISGCHSQKASSPVSEEPQEHGQSRAGAPFDFYLLNLSWSPEFCYSHPSDPECASHLTFVLHGLWPQNNDGTYPQNCSSAPGPANPSQYRDLYPNPGLLGHEWQKHGTCSGLSPEDYFSSARKALRSVKIPAQLTGLKSQASLPPGQIMVLFSLSNPHIPLSAMAVSCGNNYLTAFEVCLDKSLHPIACSAVRSCRANTVRIPPP